MSPGGLSGSVRTSGRARQPPKRYANEAFTAHEDLDPVSEHEVEPRQRLEESSSDEEFDEIQADEDADDLEGLQEDVTSSAESDASGIPTPDEASDDVASKSDADPIHTHEDGTIQNDPTIRRNSIRRRPRPRVDGMHTRGIADPVISSSKKAKSTYYYSLFGSATEDLVHMARSRDQWCHEAMLPTRPNGSGTRGMHHPFSRTEEQRQLEATVGWNWYYDHGGQRHLAKIQATYPLNAEEGLNYVPRSSHAPWTIFMGPYGRQSRFDLPSLRSMPLNEAWEQAFHQANADSSKPERAKGYKGRDGWMLNVGTCVRCVEWAPNHVGDTQYLAISTLQLKGNESFNHSKSSPAFTAQSFPSSVQIWSFSSTEGPGRKSLLNPDSPPCLRLVVCTDWGDAKHLRWCPMPRNCRKEGQGAGTPIGLLACVWSDGYVRVLDIYLDHSTTSDTNFVKFTTAAFTAKPSSTLCTCVTWLSPTDLAVGCANGYVALWSIYPYAAPSSSPSAPKAALYTQFHTSYVSSLSSAYPLAPHLLATTSPSGHLRLTSLLSPHTDFVTSIRLRHPPSHVHFSEPCHAFIAVDETESARLWPIRRFYSPLSVARNPSQGIALGIGSVHASVIMGCADGTVCVSNPMRKYLYPRLAPWQCPVFKHDFVRGEPQVGSRNGGGRVRITEGFKAHEAGVHLGLGKTSVDGVIMATIYEEEGQVRCVSWGKELGTGGWVAVGMGSGLVRVEDVAI
ncbi:MAG: hypothetical protein Q9182_005817 [Xanthomendoza sp. 2 TL-2023]